MTVNPFNNRITSSRSSVSSQTRGNSTKRKSILQIVASGAGTGALIGLVLGALTAACVYWILFEAVRLKDPPKDIFHDEKIAFASAIILGSTAIGSLGCAIGFLVSALGRHFGPSNPPSTIKSDDFAIKSQNISTFDNSPLNDPPGEKPIQTDCVRIPMLAILGFCTMMYSWMLEMMIAIGHHYSGGKWPSLLKFIVVTFITAVSTFYRITARKKHRVYFPYLNKAELTAGQAVLLFCFVVGWAILGVWLAVGPPGPPFKPA